MGLLCLLSVTAVTSSAGYSPVGPRPCASDDDGDSVVTGGDSLSGSALTLLTRSQAHICEHALFHHHYGGGHANLPQGSSWHC